MLIFTVETNYNKVTLISIHLYILIGEKFNKPTYIRHLN